MPVIESAVDTGSEEFRERREHMEGLLAALREETRKAVLGGSERAREKHVGRGKLLVRDRIEALLDPASPFLELSPLAGHGLYGESPPAAGIVTGIGRVAGRPVVIVANDATVDRKSVV